MERNDVVVLHPAIAIAGRVMFALIFFLSGVAHFTDLNRFVALMRAAIPFRTIWVMTSAVVELVGATLIAMNRYPCLAAWLIVVLLVPVMITLHGVAMLPAPDEQLHRIKTV